MKRQAIYPGTFDPITEGHLDIIKRAAKQFDVLYVAVMNNPAKHNYFTKEERVELIKKCVKNIKNVKVVSDDGLTINFAKKLKANVIIRGIRAVTDYEAELALATSNMIIDDSIETMFFIAKPELSFLSSSIAKQIAHFGGDISKFIPRVIQKDVLKRFSNKNKA